MDWRVSGTGSDLDRLWWADRPSATFVSTVSLPGPVEDTFYDIDITATFNGWQSGSLTNYGVELRPILNTNNNFNFFASSRTDDPNHRPSLIIEYDAEVPEPTSVALLLLGVVALWSIRSLKQPVA